jgi:hypothetical protein
MFILHLRIKNYEYSYIFRFSNAIVEWTLIFSSRAMMETYKLMKEVLHMLTNCVFRR